MEVNDLVSRQDAVKAICAHLPYVSEKRAEIILRELPSAQPTEASCWGCNCPKMERLKEQKTFSEIIHLHDAEQQWIPCSERLPKNGRQVLVYARSVHYALAKYDEMREADGTYKKQWVTFDAWKPFYTIKDVLAWRELPEPWKGEQS